MQTIKHNEVSTVLLNPEALKSDAKRVGKIVSTQQIVDFLGAFCTPGQVAPMSQKQRLTLALIAEFVTTGGTSGYMRESALLGAMLALMPESTRVGFDDAQHAMGLQGTQFTQPVPGVSRARMVRFFGSKPSAGTVLTRLSQIRGMWDLLGVTEKTDAHGFALREGAKGSPLLVAYAHALEQMTDGQLALLTKE